MKKLLLGLGSVASVIAPVAAVISCGDDTAAADTAIVGTTLDATKQTTLKTAANTALGMNANDIESVAKITNYTFTVKESVGAEFVDKSYTFKNAVIYNLKKSVTTLSIDYGSGTSSLGTNGGGQVVVGVTASTARVAGATPHLYVLMRYGLAGLGGINMSLNEVTDATKMAAIKQHIMESVFAPAAEVTKVTLQLGASTPGTPITWSSILTKIKADSNYDVAKTTSVDLVIDAKTLTLTFAANANDAALKTAMTNALSGATGFTNCFDTAN